MRPLPDTPSRPPSAPHPRRGGFAFLLLLSSAYLGLMVYVDRDTHVFSRLAELPGPLALCTLLILGSFVLRYQRWHRILHAQRHDLPWWDGLRAYIAGFAFTASPGKAGELLRIRYFGDLHVPAHTVLATFVVERGLDLLIITLLGLGAAALIPAFGVLAALVAACLGLLYLTSSWPALLPQIATVCDRMPGAWIRRTAVLLVAAIGSVGPLLRPSILLPWLIVGTMAWLLTALAFTMLCSALGLSLAWPYALGIYPVAMLAGAASFAPGGVGTTEAATVLMLSAVGASMETAVAAAIGIRLASLWFAIALGMLAMGSLEIRPARRRMRPANTAPSVARTLEP